MLIYRWFFILCILLSSEQYVFAIDEVHSDPMQIALGKELITDKKAKKMILKNPIPETVDATVKGEEFLIQGTESDISYRQNIFTSLDVISKNIIALLKEEAGEPSDLITLAEALSAQSSLVGSAFGKDTRSTEGYTTHAKPIIWENLPKFQAKADKFAERASNFSTLVSENDNVTIDDFAPVLSSCKSCHEAYLSKNGK